MEAEKRIHPIEFVSPMYGNVKVVSIHRVQPDEFEKLRPQMSEVKTFEADEKRHAFIVGYITLLDDLKITIFSD